MPGYSADRYQAERYILESFLIDLDSVAAIKCYITLPGDVKVTEFFYVVQVAAGATGAVVSLESPAGTEKATISIGTDAAGTLLKATNLTAFECNEGTALAFKLKTALAAQAGDGFAGVTYMQKL